MTIIGISGPSGSGKDLSADYLSKLLKIDHVSGGDVLRSMLRTLDLSPEKDKLLDFGTFIRKHYGAEVIYSRVMALAENKSGIIWSGFRSPSEAQIIKSRGGKILYIDAPMSILHSRIKARQRDGDNFERTKFISHERTSAKFDTGENLARVKAMADFIVDNNGSIEQLYLKLDHIVDQITKVSSRVGSIK